MRTVEAEGKAGVAMGGGMAGLGNKASGPMHWDRDDGDLREARATRVRASVAPPTLVSGKPWAGSKRSGSIRRK